MTSTATHTHTLPRLIVRWYFLERPGRIVRAYLDYATAFGEAFSFIFLLRTLFAPWKNIQDDYPRRGLNLSLILQTWTFNVIVRAIGAVIRIGAVAAGLTIQLLLIAGFAVYLALWITFPVVCIAGILFLFGLL